MSTTTTRPAASRRNPNFARDAVFAAFRPRQARALDQADFQDRAPDQLPQRHIEADAGGGISLDQLAAALRLDGGDDAESQTAGA